MKNYIILFVSTLLLASCLPEEEDKDFTLENETDIQQYIVNNNLSPTKTDSGLYYIIEEEGTGDLPSENSDVKVKIKGSFLDGSSFTQISQQQDYIIDTFNLQETITGLKEGVSILKEGSKATLIIPSNLGYGNSTFRNIPAGSVLIMEVELITSDIKKQNDEDILKYITDNNLEANKTESGLYYAITKTSDKEIKPNTNSNVTVAYKGMLLDGTVFDDQSGNLGVSFSLSNVIPGWTEGIPLFKEGEEGVLLIPSHLGYGNSGIGNTIKGGDVLIFDINLIKVN